MRSPWVTINTIPNIMIEIFCDTSLLHTALKIGRISLFMITLPFATRILQSIPRGSRPTRSLHSKIERVDLNHLALIAARRL